MDRRANEDAVGQEFLRRKQRVESFLAGNPRVRERVEARRPKGKPCLAFEDGDRDCVRFLTCFENVICLTGATITRMHCFVPSTRITVTVHLLRQERRKFPDIEEFRKLGEEFIEVCAGSLAAGATR